jgi:hypothetical protein
VAGEGDQIPADDDEVPRPPQSLEPQMASLASNGLDEGVGVVEEGGEAPLGGHGADAEKDPGEHRRTSGSTTNRKHSL